jgi:heme oxygenase
MATHPKPAGGADALSTMMREGTSVNHREAERRPFMRVFFKGQLPREPYVAWIGRQWFVYEAIEQAAEQLRDDPIVGVMHTPEIRRQDRLGEDLKFFLGPDWRDRIAPSPATEKYVERIQWCRDEFPAGWVAHQWLRYMGNIGGQEILRRLVTKSQELTDDRGLAFYQWPDIGEVSPFFGRFHARMDSMDLDLSMKQRVVEEADQAFLLNMMLTDELAADFGIEAPDGDPDQEYEALTTEAGTSH